MARPPEEQATPANFSYCGSSVSTDTPTCAHTHLDVKKGKLRQQNLFRGRREKILFSVTPRIPNSCVRCLWSLATASHFLGSEDVRQKEKSQAGWKHL